MKHGASRPIRLLMVSITFDPEPGAIHGLPLARWLTSTSRYEVEVLTAVPWYPLGRTYPGYRMRPQREVLGGITVHRVPLFPSHDMSAVRRILTYVSFMFSALLLGMPRIRRPDVVYYFDNLPTTGTVAYIIARLTGAATVQHVADLWPDTVTQSGMVGGGRTARIVEAVLERWCGFLYRRHARMTVLSPGFRRTLGERGIPEGKIEVVYNWADEARFRPEPRDAAVRSELCIDDRLCLLYAGNIGPLQGIETLLEGASRLLDLPNVLLAIAGTGPREAAVRALAARSGLANVRLLGRLPLESMARINGAADALIVHLRDTPFLRATIPGKIQVGLACGRPLLVGVRGDAADLVHRSGAGIVFAPEDPDDFARAARQFAALTEAERARMGRAGRKFYEESMAISVGAQRMDAVFQAAAGEVPDSASAPARAAS